jgi:coenzyme F420-reducing hydrogenase delta subunit
MYFLSSAEGARFAEIATEMTERALRLGPNPLNNRKRIEQPMEDQE